MKTDTEVNKTARFEARLSEAQKALFLRAASLGGHRTLSDFIINSAQEKAEALVRETEVLQLSQKDRKVFVNALLHPPKPNKKLREAAEHYKNLTTSQ